MTFFFAGAFFHSRRIGSCPVTPSEKMNRTSSCENSNNNATGDRRRLFLAALFSVASFVTDEYCTTCRIDAIVNQAASAVVSAVPSSLLKSRPSLYLRTAPHFRCYIYRGNVLTSLVSGKYARMRTLPANVPTTQQSS